MGNITILYIQKTSRLSPGIFENTGFAKVGTPLGWFTTRASDIEWTGIDTKTIDSFQTMYQKKEVETLEVLCLGSGFFQGGSIYPFLEELLGKNKYVLRAVCDYKVCVPDHKVLPMLYRLYDQYFNVMQKKCPDDLWPTEIQHLLESIIDVTSPTQKFKTPEWEGFEWYWSVLY